MLYVSVYACSMVLVVQSLSLHSSDCGNWLLDWLNVFRTLPL